MRVLGRDRLEGRADDGLDLLLLVPPDFIFHPAEGGIPTRDEMPFLPYGALSLASFLRFHDKRVMVAPMQTFYQQAGRFRHYDDGTAASLESFTERTDRILKALLRRLQPRTLGLSISYAIHHRAAEIVLDLLRQNWPELPVLAGGNHASHTATYWLSRSMPVDGVALGEGERTCLAWLRQGPDGSAIPGLARRGPDVVSQRRRRAEPLSPEELGVIVDPSLTALPRWAPLGGFSPLLATSRGCLHRCVFCTSRGMWKGRRLRPLESVAAEVAALVASGARRVLLTDDMLDVRAGRLEALADVFGRFRECRFSAPFRLESLERCPPELLVRAGIDRVLVGVESFSPQVLRAMDKNLSTASLMRVERTLARLRQVGVGATLFMLIGHPGASRRLDMMSARRCHDLASQGLLQGLSAVHLAPFPGTSLATWAAQGRRLRVIEPRMNRWTLDQPIIELLDPRGRVRYSAADMREVFQAFRRVSQLCEAYEKG